jgi:hypothetical protein
MAGKNSRELKTYAIFNPIENFGIDKTSAFSKYIEIVSVASKRDNFEIPR